MRNEIRSPSATYGLGYVPKASAATYDADNRLVTFNGIAVTFDANGNMLRDVGPGTAANAGFSYDARNQLREAAGVSYTSGVLGNRIGISVPGASSTKFVVDPNGALSRVLVKTTTSLTKTATYYVYGLGLIGE